MKKYTVILLMISLLLTGCSSGKLHNFGEYKPDLTRLAYAARDHWEAQTPQDGHCTLAVEDHSTWAGPSAASAIESLSELGIGYLWVSGEYVIFWEDEQKTYGILYSESPQAAIEQLRSWYSGMKYSKIEENWYEIGQLGSI